MHFTIPDNFMLGASSSAWQTEGWAGKKEGQDSYLDAWYKAEPGVWHNGLGPDVATRFMDKYQEDVDLMANMGLTHYRTSINWSRFMTDYETGEIDEEYAAHIDTVVDALIAAGVTPMLCLEHYELPQVLNERYGGWGSRHVVDLYAQYARAAFERFGDRVHEWYTFNEPIVIQTRCYLDAARWPYEQDTAKWMLWNYHKVLASAAAVKVFKEGGYEGRIGCILNPEMVYPRSPSSEADCHAARMYDLFFNRVFFDPMILGSYPAELVNICKQYGVWPQTDPADLELIAQNTIQVVGVNQYYPKRVKAPRYAWNPSTPFHPEMFYESFDLPGKRMNFSRGWEIYPKVLYDMAKYLERNYGSIPWFIAENGMGIEGEERFMDESGMVQDDYRIEFIAEHLGWLLKAVEEGSACEGYLLWAFTDNVSPMNAFKNRYGFVRIELDEERTRKPKKSAGWFKQVIATHELDVDLK